MSDASVRDAVSLESLVAEVADEFLARRHRGERPAAAEYARRYPQHAAVLLQVLSSLELVELASGAGPFAAAPAADAFAVGPLGDYRIVREVGRGGMGVVYEARQLSLDRRVALKVLPFAAALDPKQLARFKNEAQAAANLHHTNIVPVFGVGCERGVHFFAMQFIDGRTLAEVVAELRPAAAAPRRPAAGLPETAADTPPVAGLPTDRSARHPEFFRAVARLGVQAAEALEYAHQEGVVHRDVKPANLLVDARGNLWVTDFGLARLRNQPGLTVSGDVVGTVRYMSPEQAVGSPAAVDHRTDVYSLGATLYELLVGRPVFEGGDRQDLLRRIAVEDPPPPRRLNPAVPAELETIVLKALDKDAGARYATARDLADDLHRFLDYQPIRARRSSPLERARKWARRHRQMVWTAAVAAAVLVATLGAVGGWALRDRAARQARADADLEAALRDAQDFRRDGKWPEARAAAARAGDLLPAVAADGPLAARAAGLLREVAEEADDRRLVGRLEELRLLQAEVRPKDNDFVLADRLPSDYRQAFAEYGLAPEATPPAAAAARLRGRPPAVRNPLLAALDHWLILARHDKSADAAWLEQVLSAADADPWRQRLRAARARNDRAALERLAHEADVAAEPPEALFTLDRSLRQRGATPAAMALLRRAREAVPGDFWMNYELAMALMEAQPPRYDEAARFLTAAAALRPDNAAARYELGWALAGTGKHEDAADCFRRAVALKPEYAAAHWQLGTALFRQRKFDEAAAAHRRAVAIKPDFAMAHYDLGNALHELGQLDEAVAAFRGAVAADPEFAEALCNLGLVLQKQGKFAEALPLFEQGHAAGTRRTHWPYDSAGWLKACQRYVALERRLPAVLAGRSRPADAAEADTFARLCCFANRYTAGARLLADGLAADPKGAEDVDAAYRYDAACMAARAGCDAAADADQLDDEARGRWRAQAVDWLRADLAAWGNRLTTAKPDGRRRVLRRMREWQTDADLAGLRDPAALAKLPPDERRACQQLWADVAAVLSRAAPAAPAATDAR